MARCGAGSRPGTASRSWRAAASRSLTRNELPGDPSDKQSRYIEAAVNGVIVACLYAPNGNPQPGPKFDYKLAWHERFEAHAAELFATRPAGRAGRRLQHRAGAARHLSEHDPTTTMRWCSRRAARAFASAARRRAGPMRSARCIPKETVYTFWDYLRNRWERDAGLRLDHLLLSKKLARRLTDAGVDREVRGLEGRQRPRAGVGDVEIGQADDG